MKYLILILMIYQINTSIVNALEVPQGIIHSSKADYYGNNYVVSYETPIILQLKNKKTINVHKKSSCLVIYDKQLSIYVFNGTVDYDKTAIKDGELYQYNKISKFDIDKVLDELLELCKHECNN